MIRLSKDNDARLRAELEHIGKSGCRTVAIEPDGSIAWRCACDVCSARAAQQATPPMPHK